MLGENGRFIVYVSKRERMGVGKKVWLERAKLITNSGFVFSFYFPVSALCLSTTCGGDFVEIVETIETNRG